MKSTPGRALGPLGLPSIAASIGFWPTTVLITVAQSTLVAAPMVYFVVLPFNAYLIGDAMEWLNRRFTKDGRAAARTRTLVASFVIIIWGLWLLVLGAAVVIGVKTGRWPTGRH